jgi:hypothetical protein
MSFLAKKRRALHLGECAVATHVLLQGVLHAKSIEYEYEQLIKAHDALVTVTPAAASVFVLANTLAAAV